MASIEDDVMAYIRAEFLPGGKELTATTPLITSTILNSLTTLQLVGFLEETYGISVAAHEANVQYLNTVEQIAALVRGKQGKGA
jgi:acyl carrier protein